MREIDLSRAPSGADPQTVPKALGGACSTRPPGSSACTGGRSPWTRRRCTRRATTPPARCRPLFWRARGLVDLPRSSACSDGIPSGARVTRKRRLSGAGAARPCGAPLRRSHGARAARERCRIGLVGAIASRCAYSTSVLGLRRASPLHTAPSRHHFRDRFDRAALKSARREAARPLTRRSRDASELLARH